jgi:hypothetical protein
MPWAAAATLASTAISAGVGAATSPGTPQTSWQSQANALNEIGSWQSNTNTAIQSNQTSNDQLNWARQQYAQQAPVTANAMSQLANLGTTQTSQYQDIYAPLQAQYASEAANYDTPAAEQLASGKAMSDVAQATEAARSTALSNLASYGIDPSQTRYSALDLGTRVQGAAAEATAGTNARLQTQQTGLGLQANAIGQGLQVGSQGASNTNAGATLGLNTSTAYGNLMGTGTSWDQISNTAASNAITAGGQGATAANQSFNQAQTAYGDTLGQSSNLNKGVGSAVGGLLTGSNLSSAYNYLTGSSGGSATTSVAGGANTAGDILGASAAGLSY